MTAPAATNESNLAPLLESTHSAVQQARGPVSNIRPATVQSISAGRETAVVTDDHNPGGSPYGASIICPTTLFPGDRVMVMFYPPHGALILGLLRGGHMPWQLFNPALVDVPGGYGAGWVSDTGTGLPGTSTYAQLMYRRCNGVAELRGRGTRTSGVGTRIAWLPDGFRPKNRIVATVVVGPIVAIGTIQVEINGEIHGLTGTFDSGSGGFVHLDTISFSVE
jgi:hypothetical protein